MSRDHLEGHVKGKQGEEFRWLKLEKSRGPNEIDISRIDISRIRRKEQLKKVAIERFFGEIHDERRMDSHTVYHLLYKLHFWEA